jgi:hypothetical protein
MSSNEDGVTQVSRPVRIFEAAPTARRDDSARLSVGNARNTSAALFWRGTRYPDTRWRHSVRHTVTHRWFAPALAEFVDNLMQRKAFLHHVRTTGGHATVIIQFFNDGYMGDQLEPDTLAKLAKLQVDFGIECFV